jgi:hypothetical protein
MKEYGSDFFQMQADAVKSGQRVLVVDDIIATGTLLSPRSNPRMDWLHGNDLLIRVNRWLSSRSWLARNETRRHSHGLHIHLGARFPQGPRQARCARLHAPLWPGGEDDAVIPLR